MFILDILFCKIKWLMIVLIIDMDRKLKRKVEVRVLGIVWCRIIEEILGNEKFWGRKLDGENLGVKY